MEITYDSGAKVILQGPATYEVNSNGGFLSIGKLTGKLEKKGEGRGERKWLVVSGQWPVNPPSAIQNPKSLIPNP